MGLNFDISFSLKETSGAVKAFDQITVDIITSSGEGVFNFAVFDNVTFQPNETIQKTCSNYFYPTRAEGTYKVVVRGKLPSGEWFDFDTINSAVNNKSFEVNSAESENEYVSPKISYTIMDQQFNPDYPTIILTHGLQPDDYSAAKLWSGFGVKQAGTLIRDELKSNVNIIQFVWTDANHGAGGLSCDAYDKASTATESAGLALAYELADFFPSNYSKKVQFIGHSLGVVVNAYAIHHFFSSFHNTSIKDIQVTTLDRPEHVWKIPDLICLPGLSCTPVPCTSSGYPKNFLQSQIGYLKNRGVNLYIDNYYDTDGAGVGDVDNIANYNHQLKESNNVGDKFFTNEAATFLKVDNNHSGVQQWYRWSIAPNDLKSDGTNYCSDGSYIDKPDKLDPSLNPCNKGWYHAAVRLNTQSIDQNAPLDMSYSMAEETTDTDTSELIDFVENSFQTNNEKCTLTQDQLTQVYTITCDESAMSHAIVDVEIPLSTSYVTFDYKYTQLDDDDYFVVFIGNRPITTLKKSGSLEGEYNTSGLIPVDIKNSPQKLKVVLFGSGASSEKIYFSNFRAFITQAEKKFP